MANTVDMQDIVLTVANEIVIEKPVATVWSTITTVSNWAGMHPGSQKITGEGTEKEGKGVGFEFKEAIKNQYLDFVATWVITKVVPGKFFQFKFASSFQTEIFDDMTISYTLQEVPEGTYWHRSMVSFLKPGHKAYNYKSSSHVFPESVLHENYLKRVKAKLEGSA